jgi:hypothetical protein
MATSNPIPDTGLTGSAPLYTRVEPLSVERHGKLGVKRLAAPFGFASNIHFVPLLLPEFPAASGSYPIIFAGDDKVPLAVMGITPGENLFFDKNGVAKSEIYLPAYIRRFPFIVATVDDSDRGILCLDVGADIVAEGAEMAIFNGQELSDYGKTCVDYCQRFEEDKARSDAIMKQIIEMDLFHLRQTKHQPRDIDNNPVGEEIIIAEYFAIEEPKVHALSADKLVALRDTGALAFIYAHLVSAWKWDALISLEMTRLNPPANPANAA